MRVSSPFKSSPVKVKKSCAEDCFAHLPETPQNPPQARKRFSPIKTKTSKKKPPQQQQPSLDGPSPTKATTTKSHPRSRKSSSSHNKPLLGQQSRTASSSTTHCHRINLPESLSFTQQRRTLCTAEDAFEAEDNEEPSPCVEIVSRKAKAKKLGLASRVRRKLQFTTAASAMRTWGSSPKKYKRESTVRKGFQRLGTAEGSPEDVFRDYDYDLDCRGREGVVLFPCPEVSITVIAAMKIPAALDHTVRSTPILLDPLIHVYFTVTHVRVHWK
ncbi:uncharacterized protein BO97DRAFT_475200 [Aspergillus homomorphus CBS 101889]|uniref:Uncharacterized protein n=1 Tax=Aspergillus homomorphus (strain CBS 101889) TaxID=1450537 RepID=A0A395I8P5_ASPHC|nr:hypothetical protein BO97DRAFT_475200 [Aspergillus homomorphus CBS 101889]RAL16401.1 hypothetical protein BO97DRAFT_475200 [Aspergillus homomorphus CBS 101889]